MSRYKDRSGESVKCEDCKYNDKEWYELPCDACCPAHSGFELKDKEQKNGQIH